MTTETIETIEDFETFADLGLSENILKALTEMGFTKPSPIQAQGIPAVMQGSDVIGQA